MPALIVPALTCMLLLSTSCSSMQSILTPQRYAEDSGIDELMDMISRRYIGTYDEEELIIEARRAIVDSLDDNWSYYMSPDEYTYYLENSNNTYQGIGVEVQMDDENGGIEVMGVYSGSGAEAAGIVIGDVITAVDGVSLRGMDLSEVRDALRRQLDDTAMLSVLRADGRYYEIPVVYSVIFQDPVSYEMLADNIGYVYLRNFEGGSAERFIGAVEDLIMQGATAFIYDVRSNNGGRVTEMCEILDFLLPEGEIFISINKAGDEQIIESDESFIDLPAVVLVNHHSYSGAEYFTVVLSEYGYAPTVGEQTTGKNRMQSTYPMSDGGALHISTGMFLTPNHIDLFEQGGYTPDYIIEFTEEEEALYYRGELEPDDDPQLQKAVELLHS